MGKTFKLEIVTPEMVFYTGDVEIVVVRTLLGEEGFLADHVWVCKLLDSGELRIREPGSKEHRLANISGGFIDVHGDVLIFTDSAEWAEGEAPSVPAASPQAEKASASTAPATPTT